MIYRIIKYGDGCLQKKAEFLKTLTREDKDIINNMIETLYATENAVGLAANQVAILKMIFVLDIDWVKKENAKKNPMVFINPEIIWESEEDEILSEGCLSFPGIEAEIYRSVKIKLKYRDINFDEKIIDAEGFFARAIQHETDHLNGVLIVDRMATLKKKLISGKLHKLKSQTISEISEIRL